MSTSEELGEGGALEVRVADDAAVASLVPLLLAQQEEHGVPVRPAALERQLRAQLAHPSQGFVLAAWRGPEALGVAYVSFAWPLEHDGEVAWLEELYVAPAARGGGVGQSLLHAVLERADARGCVSVDLEVAADHARAARLYERAGFRSMHRTHYTRPLRAWDWGDDPAALRASERAGK